MLSRHLLTVLSIGVLCLAQQQPFKSPGTTRTTVIDVLAQDPDHSLLVRLLQKARLVVNLNLIQDVTVFAPTNEAIKQSSLGGFLELNEGNDNIQATLRRQLLYHCLNYTLELPRPEIENVTAILETLLFPHPEAGRGKPGEQPSPFPSLPGPDQHSLLGGEGQKVRLRAISTQYEGNLKIGVDGHGSGGVDIIKSKIKLASNGIVIPINGMLKVPPPISDVLQSHPKLKQISAYYSKQELEEHANTPNLTLFAPTDHAWNALDPLERQYLASGYAQDDLKELFENHAAVDSHIGYSERLAKQENLRTVSGEHLLASVSDGRLKINGSTVKEADIFAQNGVVHIVDQLLLPAGSLQLTPEKYLIALNCTKFVTLLRSSNLTSLVQSNEESYTILAAKDDVLSNQEWEGGWRSASLPAEGSEKMSSLLRYHVLPGRFVASNLSDGMLLDTMLESTKLKGARQKLSVDVSSNFALESFGKGESSSLGFGNAMVIGEPVIVGKSIIYLISQILEPPTDVLDVAMSDLRLSTFVAALYAAKLDKQLREAFAVTFFVPVNEAFSRLGLVMNYLLLSQAKDELKSMLQYHVVDKIVYSAELAANSSRYTTLEGSSVFVDAKNKSISLHGPTIGGFPSSGQLQATNITDANLLTETGVLHVVDQVMLPPTLDISIAKLLRGGKASTMAELVRLANLTHVLDGSQLASSIKSTSNRHAGKYNETLPTNFRSFTLLSPTDRAFNRVNLTYYLNDRKALQDLVRLHIIPSDAVQRSKDPSLSPIDGRPLTLNDEATYDTLLSRREGGPSAYGTLAFRQFGQDGWLVGIQGARNSHRDWARVTNFGRARPRFSVDDEVSTVGRKRRNRAHRMAYGGGVLLIDSVLEPYQPDWFTRWGWIALTVCLCLSAVACISVLAFNLWRSNKEQQYQALENEED